MGRIYLRHVELGGLYIALADPEMNGGEVWRKVRPVRVELDKNEQKILVFGHGPEHKGVTDIVLADMLESAESPGSMVEYYPHPDEADRRQFDGKHT